MSAFLCASAVIIFFPLFTAEASSEERRYAEKN
jgi:hypothetical protein